MLHVTIAIDYSTTIALGGEPNDVFWVFFFGAILGRKAKKHG